MAVSGTFSKLIALAARNERRLGAVLFGFGFLTDLFTFGILSAAVVSYFFIAYLFLAAISAVGAHYFAGTALSENEPRWRRALAVLCPLAAQYAFGGLLSGLVVFYAANSFLAVSWPFILLIGIVYFGNEYFRMYKHYLVFQTTLFFFTLYAYTIFGLPLVVKSLGPVVFGGSTLVALVLFAVFLYALKVVNPKRMHGVLRQIVASVGTVVILISGSYFLGLIPPIPLALADSGVYHGLTRVSGGYRVLAEEPPAWWNIFPPTIHHVPGEQLYAFSAVAAPIEFGTAVAHRWERNIPGKGWTTENRVSFPITGGRAGGYRGYSYRSELEDGEWRVSVETVNGQVIGRIRFNVESADTRPALHEETL